MGRYKINRMKLNSKLSHFSEPSSHNHPKRILSGVWRSRNDVTAPHLVAPLVHIPTFINRFRPAAKTFVSHAMQQHEMITEKPARGGAAVVGKPNEGKPSEAKSNLLNSSPRHHRTYPSGGGCLVESEIFNYRKHACWLSSDEHTG